MSILRPELFTFLADLAQNNDRDWFNANKDRFERDVMAPSLAFVEAFRPKLHEISPRFLAIAKKQGGSLFRIFRDTRFSKDKTPYKKNVGFQFRHDQAARDVHAPGFYLHIEPGNVGVGCGMWHPDNTSLQAIRERVVGDSEAFTGLKAELEGAGLSFFGASLKRPPRGFDKDHEHIEDLKRKDWAVHRELSEEAVVADDFLDALATEFRKAAPLVRFLCDVQGLPF
ncbi:MAG: DUF2461 domain-containing protein [Myxococcales bacterium]|nr:DUF2461 domain-containing protein [Myxococcales bacterium]